MGLSMDMGSCDVVFVLVVISCSFGVGSVAVAAPTLTSDIVRRRRHHDPLRRGRGRGPLKRYTTHPRLITGR